MRLTRSVITENVMRKPSSLAAMGSVFPSCGSVTMKTMKCVRADTENAPNQNSDVATTSVFLQDGDVTTMTTAVMAVTNQTA